MRVCGGGWEEGQGVRYQAKELAEIKNLSGGGGKIDLFWFLK